MATRRGRGPGAMWIAAKSPVLSIAACESACVDPPVVAFAIARPSSGMTGPWLHSTSVRPRLSSRAITCSTVESAVP